MSFADRLARVEDRLGASPRERHAAAVSAVMDAVLRDAELQRLSGMLAERIDRTTFTLPDDEPTRELGRRFNERLETLKGPNP